MTHEQPADFVRNRMRMSRAYQPVMLMTLLRGGGKSSSYAGHLQEDTGARIRRNEGSAWGLGLVDFVFRPHLNADYFPMANMQMVERAAKLHYSLYAIDDEMAIKVVDGDVEVVSEGGWRLVGEW